MNIGDWRAFKWILDIYKLAHVGHIEYANQLIF